MNPASTRLILKCLLLLMLSESTFACSCIPSKRTCEYLNNDMVFVGKVTKISRVRHMRDKDSWSPGYSMVFDVEDVLRGVKSQIVNIETGNGGGDCGTPLPVGGSFIIFAGKDEEGRLWTGMCSGNVALTGNKQDDEQIIGPYRQSVTLGVGKVFGTVYRATPKWKEDDVDRSSSTPMSGLIVHAKAQGRDVSTTTDLLGDYEFPDLPNGVYNIVAEVGRGLDYSHEYEEHYNAEISNGSCSQVSFRVLPTTRIKGRVFLPTGTPSTTIQVVALPIHLKKVNQFSGVYDFTEEDGTFDLWPLPKGNYYVGVNINSSPKEDEPFLPTYYPGVTNVQQAEILHLEEGDVKEVKLNIPTIARPRKVHLKAVGLDGKPMRTIYIQIEDLRHRGDAFSYKNVELDANGRGTMTLYSGFDYHLHGSHFVKHGTYWCAKPVEIVAGMDPVTVQFTMNRKDQSCDIYEIDGLTR